MDLLALIVLIIVIVSVSSKRKNAAAQKFARSQRNWEAAPIRVREDLDLEDIPMEADEDMEPSEGVPRVAVSMDSRLQPPPIPRVETDHLHPSAQGEVCQEYVPNSGSMQAPVTEGCEELANVRYVKVEKVQPAAASRLNPHNVVEGILWSQVLGKRGGRRAM